ncbi:diguanylate cyclase (GGDEF)-like protein [Methylobacterium sp. BE186]|uniref:GGDEF domain-containing protein n=1 Tax=Methylobacterium sp. BE186 TaxID=2817715 RepID=UPI002856F68F|nr:GGDEF domain-containing protein [Methylobacterium sp. BE186]MDR7035665.1 diguanylate cyclase (GGDEF)-like protein [Methylobacterium sp. BE186]
MTKRSDRAPAPETPRFSEPRTRFVRWLMRPHRSLSPAIHPILLANYFANAKALFLGGLNSVLVAAALALWLGSPLVAAVAAADLGLLAARLAVRARCHRNAASGRATATDLYVALNLLWPTLQGCVSLCAVLSGDWPSILLASISAVAVMGPLCVRNFSVPNLAMAQCTVLILPTVISGGFVDAPLLLLFLIQLPFAVLAVRGVTEQVAVLAGGAFRATLENERKALCDDLTGLGNRRAFERHRQADIRPGGPDGACLFCLDLDGFKPINDTYGHPAGDAVLVAVAGRLGSAFGTKARVFRLGGDEFAAVATGLDLGEVHALGQRVIEAVGRPIALADGSAVEVGITVGAAVAPGPAAGQADLLRLADEALYRAKAAGKRRIEVILALGSGAPAAASPAEAPLPDAPAVSDVPAAPAARGRDAA